MKGINKKIICSLLEKAGVTYNTDEDGSLLVLQGADEDFPHNVLIYIIVNNNRLSFFGGAPDYHPEGNLLEMANNHNLNHFIPIAVVRDGNVRMEQHFILDEEVSEQHVIENCLLMPLASIWHAFKDFENKA